MTAITTRFADMTVILCNMLKETLLWENQKDWVLAKRNFYIRQVFGHALRLGGSHRL